MAVSYCSPLLFLVACSSFLVTASVQNFAISNGTFSNNNMKLVGGSHVSSSGSVSLLPDDNPRQGAGVAYYHRPVRMLDYASRSTASFSIWFKSYQIAETFTNSSTDRRGDGMTLCFSSDGNWVGGVAARLGFYPMGENRDPKLKLFAVEYDTFNNTEYKDPLDNHVGIDVETPLSVIAKGVSSLGVIFWEGVRVDLYSWIDYNGTAKIIEVRVANKNDRPATPALTYSIDLYDIMNEEMWVGFSAGTGDAYSWYVIEEWQFVSSGLPSKKSSSSMGLIIGCVLGGVAFLTVVALGVCMFIRTRRKDQESRADESLPHMVGMPDYYSYKQLSVATKAFCEVSKLGEGGFGSVYRGVLPSNGFAVAVKRVSADSKQGEREFLAEVSIISQLRHRNVVQLVGWCKDRGKFLLVYELMPNGSLDKALFHPKSPEHVLSWEQRLKILSGLASALHYLHEEWRQQVIHRDVKSSNIMLDDEFNAKLGDFGLARLVDHSKNATTTLVAGTYGYLAPEATGTGKFTDKTDVYAFGAVALEIATGRKAFDGSAGEDDYQLVDMVWRRLSGGQLISVVDRRLDGKFDVRAVEVVLLMGLHCSHPDPKSRPSMRQVIQVLAGDAPVPPVPASKPSPIFSSEFAITLQDLENCRSSDNNLSGPSSIASSTTYNSSSLFSKSSTFDTTKP